MKTIIFDFDGTLTKKSNEIWRRVWIRLDAQDIDDELYTKASNGEISYEEWCKEIEKEFSKRKLSKAILEELAQDIKMMENLEETLNELKNRGYDLRILSGGINYVINYLLKDKVKYFSDIRTNNFYFDENGYLVKIQDTDSDEEGKARYILNHIKETSSKPEEIIFIGNGHNDRFVSQTGCHTICLNPNGTNHKDTTIWHTYIDNTEDLKDILPVIEKIENKNKIKNQGL